STKRAAVSLASSAPVVPIFLSVSSRPVSLSTTARNTLLRLAQAPSHSSGVALPSQAPTRPTAHSIASMRPSREAKNDRSLRARGRAGSLGLAGIGFLHGQGASGGRHSGGGPEPCQRNKAG